MNTHHHIWMITERGHREVLAKVRRARSSAFAAAFSGLGRCIARAFCWAYGSYRRMRRNSGRYRALNNLNDAVLKDIGLSRSEIPYAVTTQDFEEERERLRDRLNVRQRAMARDRGGKQHVSGETISPLPLSIRIALEPCAGKDRAELAHGLFRGRRRHVATPLRNEDKQAS